MKKPSKTVKTSSSLGKTPPTQGVLSPRVAPPLAHVRPKSKSGPVTPPGPDYPANPGLLKALNGLLKAHYLIAIRVTREGSVYYIPRHWAYLTLREAPGVEKVGKAPGVAPGYYYIHTALKTTNDLKNYFLYE